MRSTDRCLADAARSADGAGSIAFRVGEDGPRVVYRIHGTTIEARDGDGAVDGADTIVALSPTAWRDLVDQDRTIISLFLAGELQFVRGGFDRLARWDPALRYLHARIPVYDPARANLAGRDPAEVYEPETDTPELRAQLGTMGFLHLRGVFRAEEMASANAEVDRLSALAQPGDDRSWWATTPDGEQALCRLVYSTLRSEVLAGFERDPRTERLGRLLDPDLRVAPDRMEGTSVVMKLPGSPQGLSNIPWHQDCGMGGHRVLCPNLSVGIQLTGSSEETGNLLVVPGSHGQTLPYRWDRDREDVPVAAVNTEVGDVTVHVADVMHASPPPTGPGGRRTMYVTFYPPSVFRRVGPGEAFNDLVRNRTRTVAALHEH